MLSHLKREDTIPFLVALGFLIFVIAGPLQRGGDYFAPIVALQAELQGLNAYGPEVFDRIAYHFTQTSDTTCESCAAVGFPYPLPVIWMALPAVWAPEAAWLLLWDIVSIALLLAGLWLLRLSPLWVLWLPVFQAVLNANINGMLLGLTLIAIWAMRQEHYHLAGFTTILLGMSKPQAAGLFAVVLALILLRRRQWHALIITGGIVTIATFAVQPDWIQQFLQGVQRYGSNLFIMYHAMWSLPLAVVAALRRQWWAALALVQVSAPVLGEFYPLTPLVVLGLDRPVRQQNLAILAASLAGFFAPEPLGVILVGAITTAVFFFSPQPTPRFP